MAKLSKTEKDRIEAIYKCQRSILEQDIQDELKDELDILIGPLNATIKTHNEGIAECESLIEVKKNAAGYGTLNRYGCCRSHPWIDTFRTETNNQLMKLWSGEVNAL